MKRSAFAERVERGMRARGLSLRALCRELRLDPSFFSKVLAGKRNPPAEEEVLRRLALLLGLDPVELIVSTGRVPAEWQRRLEDPGLLEAVGRLVRGQGLSAPADHPRSQTPLAPPPAHVRHLRSAGGEFSDELL